ncbi:tRNA uracil 4-sulfurtransferase ThiI [Murdochiella vaginalis]|uniref:tRNA uracil 4-sulfurtransferase ThiI n=1 Tax=Murdochiella vaginalis TaxID=1852373 RepID=UPI0009F717C1|nr:tRNA uracil 4-sulfurtransferase ThiI [Murdochiella vaginalis]
MNEKKHIGMQSVVSVSYGELVLKGKNRGMFVAAIKRHLHRALQDIHVAEEFEQFGKLFFVVREEDVAATVSACRRVFGLLYVTPGLRVACEETAIREACRALMTQKLAETDADQTPTFKVKVKRSNKTFPIPSPDFAAIVGDWMLTDFPSLRVDVRDPQITLAVEIREDAFVSVERYEGVGGLPAGSGGRGLLLLSGGIDSPVAGYEIARRGLALGGVHFHSYPFTSERAQDKAKRLKAQLERSVGPMRLYMINLVKIYTAIAQNCRKKNTTLLSRRMMMRIADRLCERFGYHALITGESLGQVASQTVQGIHVVNNAAFHPILRPLIATDKTAIIEVARELGTYELSIEPYDDCCSLFAPEHPNTRPALEQILEDEGHLDVEALVEEALETLEIVE